MRSQSIILALLLLLAGLPQAPAADIVKDGKAVATIVTLAPELLEPEPPKTAPKGKAAPKRKAAQENDEAAAVRLLNEWLKKITDTELPVSATAPANSPAIYIGRAALQAGLKLDDISSPSHEGIRIVADEKKVLIAGQSDASTVKAVCRFLESIGCRYFMDGALGEVFPRQSTLAVGPLSITEKPGLLERNPKGPSWNARLWKAWNGGGGENFQHSHSWGRYIPPALFDEHPEYFAMGADGQRKASGWLCTSNPDLRQRFAEGVIAAIESGTKHPSLSPTDGRAYCQCPACKAQDDPASLEPSNGTVAVTNRYVDFFDDVARRVAVKHPESVLSFYCYADYTQPPTNPRKLAPNLCAMIAPIRYCRLHEVGHEGCASRMQQVSMTDGWAAVASRLGYYNYMYNLADGTLPFFKFTACKREIPYLFSKGLSYMTIEVLSNWHIYGPQIYLSLRLAYDPTADADAIMEDYWQKFYGPHAAPLMKDYWMGIDAAQGRLQSHAGSFYGLQQIYTPEFMERCAQLLAKAAEAAKGDAAYEQRVALHTDGFKSAVDYHRISDAMNRGDFVEATRIYEELTTRLKGLAGKGLVNPEYATAYLERFLSKSLRAGAALTTPPNRLLQVLPERWQFAFDEADAGGEKGFASTAFDDRKWATVATHGITLDAQGFDRTTVQWFRTRFTVPEKHEALALFFGEVDGATEVYVNGRKIEVVPNAADAKKTASAPVKPERTGQGRARTPFEVDVTGAVHAGENVVALRVDHTKITDLSLGGILRPVMLVEKPKPSAAEK